MLTAQNLSLFKDDKKIFSDLGFSVSINSALIIKGRNGCGKSSLLKTLYGELALQHGTGSVVGFDLKDMDWKKVPFLRRNLGVVFQDFQLLTDRNVHENLKFVLKATGWQDEKLMEQKIDDVLNKVGLQNKGFKMTYEMSGGEQQRVDIARAMLNSPKMILADEPTGSLDPETSDEIMQLLFQIAKEDGTAIIMATHDYMVVNKFPARTLTTEGGRLVEKG